MSTSMLRTAAWATTWLGLLLLTTSGCGSTADVASRSRAAGPSGSSGASSSSGGASSSGTTSSSGASGSSSGGPTVSCVGASSEARPQPLDVYLMLDRSPSMGDTAGATTKWAAVTSALSSFVGQPLDGTSVGLQYFPAPMDWMSGKDNTCSAAWYAKAEVEIGPLSRTAPLIRASMGNQQLQPNTPTSAALQGAIDHARAWAATAANAGHAVVVVLATDGEPTACDTDPASIDAIAAAGLGATPATRTFVIGVGPLKANLDRIAKAGGTESAFIVDTSGNVGTQFLQALNDIRKSAVGCAYAIPAPPAGQELEYGLVNVDYRPGGSGAAVPFTQVAGAAACGAKASAWYYDDAAAPKSIVLCPSTCAAVEADAAARVQIVLGCSTSAEW